ncbi:MAG: hypothetical protein RL427_286 [Bacteroidota bacterium]|jgi:hypothetical protein
MFEPTQANHFFHLVYKAIVLGIVVLIGPKATAVTYYVNDHSTTGDVYTLTIGNDTQDGLSPSTPKLTVAAVYQLAKEGDVIYIDTGIYPESQNQLILENKKKVYFYSAPPKEPVLTKEAIPTTTKTNPAEFYIENDKPVERAVYLQHKRNDAKKS